MADTIYIRDIVHTLSSFDVLDAQSQVQLLLDNHSTDVHAAFFINMVHDLLNSTKKGMLRDAEQVMNRLENAEKAAKQTGTWNTADESNLAGLLKILTDIMRPLNTLAQHWSKATRQVEHISFAMNEHQHNRSAVQAGINAIEAASEHGLTREMHLSRLTAMRDFSQRQVDKPEQTKADPVKIIDLMEAKVFMNGAPISQPTPPPAYYPLPSHKRDEDDSEATQ